ncbi:hypothetical protein [Granulosicoccus antarcticus]|uniref:hypothetical protein n=1 Tax=Granulosicoccus antarcticus TaxID=437505 RepID=UPI0012FD00EE|nr:hypothetical protein [Granulosicoccus antarcticus]
MVTICIPEEIESQRFEPGYQGRVSETTFSGAGYKSVWHTYANHCTVCTECTNDSSIKE